MRTDILSDIKKNNQPLFDKFVKREATKVMRDRLKTTAEEVKQNPDIFFAKKMNTIEGIRSVRSMLQNIPNGEAMIDNFARNHLMDKFNSLINPKEGSFKPAALSKFLKEIETSPYYKELLGKKNRMLYDDLKKQVKELREAVEHIGTSEKFYINPSQTAHVHGMYELATHTLAGLGSLFAFNPLPLIGTLGLTGGVNLLSKLLTNVKFKQQVLHEMGKLNGMKPPYDIPESKMALKNVQRLVTNAATAKEPRRKKAGPKK